MCTRLARVCEWPPALRAWHLPHEYPSSHSYNPFDGPNENPEAELPLTAGKYLYVYGDMDEDGFYEGLLGLQGCSMCLTNVPARRARPPVTPALPSPLP